MLNLDTVAITNDQLSLMKHTIGYSVDRVHGRVYRKYEAFRNHYVTFHLNEKARALDDLVKKGLASKRDDTCGGGKNIYRITNDGMLLMSKMLDVDISEQD